MGMDSKEEKNSSFQETKNRVSDSKKRSNTGSISDRKDNKMKSEKKIWSFDALVQTMKPSDEELEYRKKKREYSNGLRKNSKLFHCTTCQRNLETIIKNHEKVPTHPCLGVLMCQKCCDYYEDGEFSLDSEGEDKYCRWCGEGGTIFGCSKCICGFCAKCLKRHFKLKFFKQVQKDDNWLCFFCDPKPLWDHRFICSLAIEMSESQEAVNISPSSNKSEEERSKPDSICTDSDQSMLFKNFVSKFENGEESSRKRIYSSSSEDLEQKAPINQEKKLKLSSTSLESSCEKVENDPVENLNSDILKELERILKLSGNQMSFGVIWSKKMLKNLSNLDCRASPNDLINKCQRVKSFLSVFSAHLVHLSNSADSLENILLKSNGQKTSLDNADKEKSPYDTILQFLGFISNQVKTFIEKGISLSDILEAEVYDDVNVIGIKKKLNSSGSNFNENKNSNPIEIQPSFRNDDCNDNENREDTEEQKVDDEDKSKDGNSLEIIINPTAELNSSECDDECNDHNSSDVTPQELNYLKNIDEKDDIQEILAILENA